MAAHWTPKEDGFLLGWEGIGADYVASHDLGRPEGAGSRRMRALVSSGARKHWLVSQLAELRFEIAAGHRRGEARTIALEHVKELHDKIAELDPALAELLVTEAPQ